MERGYVGVRGGSMGYIVEFIIYVLYVSICMYDIVEFIMDFIFYYGVYYLIVL